MHITGHPNFDIALTIAFGIFVVTVAASFFVVTPYGRFADNRFGFALDPRVGWFLMELPATVAFHVTFFRSEHWAEPFPLFVLFLWSMHYLNRGFLMPLFMRVAKGQKQSFGLLVVVVGWAVTSLHGYLNATWVTEIFPVRGVEWFKDPRFIVGALLYYGGLAANLHADHIVRNLRTREEVERGERKYRIPEGGLFKYVTNASYFAELVFWVGFAILTWSPAGVFIIAISMANLVPRAIATQRWYHERFPDYPKDRKILVPFVF